MPYHAPFEQSDDVSVVGLLLEFQSTAVFHELLEFARLLLTQLFQCDLELLFLDVGVLFVFGTARQALPGK